MTRDPELVRSSTSLGSPAQTSGRERVIILGLAAAIAVVVTAYLGLRYAAVGRGGGGTLLPYQMLVRDLVGSDQAIFKQIGQSLLDAETERARTGEWPPAEAVRTLPTQAGATEGGS